MELEFYNAAMRGNIDAFKGMGSEQIESILTPNKSTILHIHFTNYTRSASEAFVEEVLGMYPSLVLKTNDKDETVLHVAARYGHHKIVKKLIDLAKDLSNEVGAEKRLIRAINDKNYTALHEAARYGHTKVVDVLIKEEPDHSYFGKNVDDETSLFIAVERRYWDIVDIILDSNSPQYDGPNGRNALHAVVLHGGKEKVSKLLARNLSATKQADEMGWVPLHLAAMAASSEVVELLVSKDRSTAYMRDNKGRTALHFAALRGELSEMEKILKYCPDCCELVDENGSNAFHYTTKGEIVFRSGLQKIMKDAPLISNLYNEKDNDGNTPLHLLARAAPDLSSHRSHCLLEPKVPRVDTMSCNKYGQTVFDVAIAVAPLYSTYQVRILRELKATGARLGGRVLDKNLREKKQEKSHDLARKASIIFVVAILIATVTFTAGFTLPGGLIQDGEHKGSPILEYSTAFKMFVLMDLLSFMLSTSAILVLFLSGFLLERHEDSYRGRVGLCGFMTVVALYSMTIAFVTGLSAVQGGGSKGCSLSLSHFFPFLSSVWQSWRW